mmetsp:Transcript_2717/g.10934  ORF Transcript_2717/g.10934 Transcript_2717/m.10934 type:complete len:234 (+) Transcript_2717:7247-7948(+)
MPSFCWPRPDGMLLPLACGVAAARAMESSSSSTMDAWARLWASPLTSTVAVAPMRWSPKKVFASRGPPADMPLKRGSVRAHRLSSPSSSARSGMSSAASAAGTSSVLAANRDVHAEGHCCDRPLLVPLMESCGPERSATSGTGAQAPTFPAMSVTRSSTTSSVPGVEARPAGSCGVSPSPLMRSVKGCSGGCGLAEGSSADTAATSAAKSVSTDMAANSVPRGVPRSDALTAG